MCFYLFFMCLWICICLYICLYGIYMFSLCFVYVFIYFIIFSYVFICFSQDFLGFPTISYEFPLGLLLDRSGLPLPCGLTNR